MPSSDKEAIIYAAIASWERRIVVCDYTSSHVQHDSQGTPASIVHDLVLPELESYQAFIENCPKNVPVKGFVAPSIKMKFNWSSFEEGFAVIHMCTEKIPVQTSIAFQKAVYQAFEAAQMPCDSDCSSFRGKLGELVKLYTENPPETRIAKVKGKQEEVKQVLIEGIELAVKRHGQIETVMEGTEDLRDESDRFKKASSQVRKTSQCQLYKTYAMIAGCAVVIIAILIIIICVAVGC